MQSETITFEDFNQICRFCLEKRTSSGTFSSIFDDGNAPLTNILTDMIRTCLGITVSLQLLSVFFFFFLL